MDEQRHTFLVNQIRILRNQVYVNEGILDCVDMDALYDYQDLQAWHLLIFDPTGRMLSGCIRALYFDRSSDFPEAESLLSLGGIELLESAERSMHIQVIQQYLNSIQRKQKSFFYVGGLAVSHPGQKLGYGACYLLFDGIGPIHCLLHRCDVQLLGLRPEGVSTSTGRIAESIKAKLQTQAVIAAS